MRYTESKKNNRKREAITKASTKKVFFASDNCMRQMKLAALARNI